MKNPPGGPKPPLWPLPERLFGVQGHGSDRAHLRFVKILLAYFSFSWKKELHVVAGDLSGTNDIAGSTSVVVRK